MAVASRLGSGLERMLRPIPRALTEPDVSSFDPDSTEPEVLSIDRRASAQYLGYSFEIIRYFLLFAAFIKSWVSVNTI